ncbi:Acyl-CoA N-acyltransferase, partial [Penicillium herquei]
MANQSIKVFRGSEVTTSQLDEAAALFRDNYGIWGKQTKRAGQRVSLSPNRLREQYLSAASSTVYARVEIDGVLAGHAFACRWSHKGLTVCWITQLVVDKKFRNIGLATSLLNALRQKTDNVYGIMSSHPAACLAAAKVFGGAIERLPLKYIATNASSILKSSPIQYIRDAKVHGTLFGDESAMISGVDSGFFVDHDEPNAALEEVKTDLQWPLGDLAEGHEFLLLIQQRRRSSRLIEA